MSNTGDERLVILLEARIRDFERNLQKASGTSRRQFDHMRQDSRRATTAMEADMARSTNRMNQALATVSMRLGTAAAAFGPVAAGVGIATGAMAGFATQARATAREIAVIGDEAKRAGISSRSFQELRYVADQNRVSIDALTDGIKEMNLRADEFIVTGSGSGAEAFQRLGYGAADLSKKLKDPSALFTEIIGKMEKMDRAAQIRVADEVFGGTGGEQFVQLIEQGEAGIRRTIDEANRLGIVMDDAMIARAAEVDRQFNMIAQTVGTTLKGAIVTAAGALADFIDGFREFENQQNRTLDAELTSLGKQRLEIETQILKLRSDQAKISDNARSLGFGDMGDRQIAKLEAENKALEEQEGKILDILRARGEFGKASKETANNLRNVGETGTEAGDALDYVARNGGKAATGLDKTGKAAAATDKAFASQLRSFDESEAALVRAIATYGQTEGSVAALEFKVREEARAWEIAREAKMDAIPAGTQEAIDRTAASIGNLTDQLQRMNLEREQDSALRMLREEAGLIGMNAEARRVAMAGLEAEATLRTQNIDAAGAWGQAYIQNARNIATMRGEIDRQTSAYERQKQIVSNLGSTFLDIFDPGKADNFFDSVMDGFADIGRQFAELGKQSLMEKIFGSAAGYTIGAPQPGQRSVAAPGFPAGYGASNDNGLRDLNVSLGRSASSAMEVARQFDGLNERADSKVLDSFMQASGTWRNLSASDTAWCAAFANAAITQSGGTGTGSNLAASFLDWGMGTNNPQPGDVVVLKPQGAGSSGHVGFLAGFEDGRVQIFGGNQSDAVNTKSFGIDQVAGYRTTAKDVSDGVVDAGKRFASGQVPGLDGWAGMRSTTADPMGGGISFNADALGAGMQTLGAGLGAFSQGYQSGSPIMGGLSGAMSGLGLAGSLGSSAAGASVLGAFGGPLGMAAVGGAVGLFGGFKAGRKATKEERAALENAFSSAMERKAA